MISYKYSRFACVYAKKKPPILGDFFLAEAEGFEPSKPLTAWPLSKRLH